MRINIIREPLQTTETRFTHSPHSHSASLKACRNPYRYRYRFIYIYRFIAIYLNNISEYDFQFKIIIYKRVNLLTNCKENHDVSFKKTIQKRHILQYCNTVTWIKGSLLFFNKFRPKYKALEVAILKTNVRRALCHLIA